MWGRTIWVKADYSEEVIEPELEEFFSYYTVQRENYGVGHIRKEEVIEC